jgi:hypothetical protein
MPDLRPVLTRRPEWLVIKTAQRCLSIFLQRTTDNTPVAIYRGKLQSLGVSRTEKRGLDFINVYSMIEVADKEIHNIETTDLTASFLQLALGHHVELLVGFGGSLFSKRLLAVRYNGKLRKERLDGPTRGFIGSALLWIGSVWLWITYGWIGFVICLLLTLTTSMAIKNLWALANFK